VSHLARQKERESREERTDERRSAGAEEVENSDEASP